MLMPCTTTRFSVGRTLVTLPVRPLSLPVRTTTLSPDLILAAMLQDLRSQRDDLHVVLGAQFAGNRAEDPRADRLVLLVDDDGGRLVETNDRAVLAHDVLGGAHDDGANDVALLHAAARNRFLHRGDDSVAHRGVAALGAAQHLDAHDPASTRIVGYLQVSLHLDHEIRSFSLRSRGGRGVRQDFPALQLGLRGALDDAGQVTDLEGVRFVVGVILLGQADGLFQDRVQQGALDLDDDSLVALVGDDHAFENTFRHLRSLNRRALLTQKRGDAGDVLAHFRDPVGLFHLAGGGLEAQVELFLLELEQLVGQLVGRLNPQIGDLGHAPTCSTWAIPASRRVTTLVRTGSLAAPRRSASRAMSSGTPSISNR